MDQSLDQAFAALADPTRRAILLRLAEGEASVAELAAPFDISQPAVSRHLKVLESARLIETEKRGQQRLRKLDPAGLVEARGFIERMATYWPDRFDRLDEFLKASEGEGA